jgi:CRISPR-associated endonuclease Csn1
MTDGDGLAAGITLRTAALGQGCELAHIIPKGSGGHNGFGNVVLGHTKCNRDMSRRTPRQFWNSDLAGGFDEGIARVEKIYSDIERPKSSEMKNATGNSLWLCYFSKRDDTAKIQQFKKDVKDIQEMTARQEAATKYASRQVMAYLADALYDGNGLPERSIASEQNPEPRRIFNNDGLWTSRLRREWGLFIDEHRARSKGLTSEQGHERNEKNRGDHRHHAIDAIVIACCTRQVQLAWEEREKKADREGVNTADDAAMENYRRAHPLPLPRPYATRDELREAVRRAVFGDGPYERPVAHRPVKRKLIGAFHKATQ